MRHISVKRWQGHPERVRIHRPALTRRCRPGNRTKIIWKFIGRTRWPTTGMGQFSRRFISTVLWMSIISGGEFGSWRKTPFTCNLLRLNAFYMQMHPGQLGRICQDTEHRKFPFMIFNEPPFFGLLHDWCKYLGCCDCSVCVKFEYLWPTVMYIWCGNFYDLVA